MWLKVSRGAGTWRNCFFHILFISKHISEFWKRGAITRTTPHRSIDRRQGKGKGKGEATPVTGCGGP
jgi:hypothetical protein